MYMACICDNQLVIVVFWNQPLSNCDVAACDRAENGVARILISDGFHRNLAVQLHCVQASCVGEGEEGEREGERGKDIEMSIRGTLFPCSGIA